MEWRKRPDLNWCFNCWFAADIESATTPIGERFLCRNCGVVVMNNGNANAELPRFFSEEEWDEYWESNLKEE